MPTLARVGRWAQDLICLSVYMCSWICVKPRLALPALRGFRLELAGEQNPIRFPYRPLGSRRPYDHGSRRRVRGLDDCHGRLRGGLSALADETITLRQGARVIEDSRKERLA